VRALANLAVSGLTAIDAKEPLTSVSFRAAYFARLAILRGLVIRSAARRADFHLRQRHLELDLRQLLRRLADLAQ